METQAAQDVKPVVQAYEHALFAREPYTLYTPGVDSRIYYLFANYCPSFILDKIIMTLFTGLKPEALKKNV